MSQDNPFRPGPGHKPPYLAGRRVETDEFSRLLEQTTILENLALTGLRGVGKTVLLDSFKPIAIAADWVWVGTDLKEQVSISEQNLALRLLTDLSTVTSGIITGSEAQTEIGFDGEPITVNRTLNFQALSGIYENTPGFPSDRLKAVLETVWRVLAPRARKGIIFAYDEAQNLVNDNAKKQYPLSLLLDVFQSIQRKNIPFMLALTGLPTLVENMVEARTYSERMFRVRFLERLSDEESRQMQRTGGWRRSLDERARPGA